MYSEGQDCRISRRRFALTIGQILLSPSTVYTAQTIGKPGARLGWRVRDQACIHAPSQSESKCTRGAPVAPPSKPDVKRANSAVSDPEQLVTSHRSCTNFRRGPHR